MGMSKTVYEENGYKNRRDYLIQMADQYDVSEDEVFILADVLGKSEDFDGLVNALEDGSLS